MHTKNLVDLNVKNDVVNLQECLLNQANVNCINNTLTFHYMQEGTLLKKYIDNQRISKVKIAEDLGMSRQNLFSLFKSKTLAPETKQRFEKYFKEDIFKQPNGWKVHVEQQAQQELIENYDMIAMKAIVDQLVIEFAMMKSKIYEIPARQILDEYEKIVSKAVKRAEEVVEETRRLHGGENR